MKFKRCCKNCGSKAQKTEVSFSKRVEKRYREYCENMVSQVRTDRKLLQPSTKYKKSILVVPDDNPCIHCEHGEAFKGPSGCPHSNICLAHSFYFFEHLKQMVEDDKND